MATRITALPHPLIDTVLNRHEIANDAALARLLKIAPPNLSKIRNRTLLVGPSLILRLHETFDMPVKEIRALAAV